NDTPGEDVPPVRVVHRARGRERRPVHVRELDVIDLDARDRSGASRSRGARRVPAAEIVPDREGDRDQERPEDDLLLLVPHGFTFTPAPAAVPSPSAAGNGTPSRS